VGMWGSLNQPYSYPTNFGYVPSSLVSATYATCSDCVATPTFSPASESFWPSVSGGVAISTVTSGASIYYTTNGTTPTSGSTLYTGPIAVSSTTTIQAIGIKSGDTNSPVASATYTAAPPALTGCFQGNSGNVNTISTGGATVQQLVTAEYSTGNLTLPTSGPDANGTSISAWTSQHPATLGVSSSGVISGVAAGTANSQVQVSQLGGAPFTCNPWTWTVSSGGPTAATPTFSPASETFSGMLSVTASSSTSGAILYCTKDGTTPTTSSPVYSPLTLTLGDTVSLASGDPLLLQANPFSLTSTVQVQCIAAASGYATSPVGSATYTVMVPNASVFSNMIWSHAVIQ
jgi:hypothetical protein